MNPLKLKPVLNKKAALKILAKGTFIAFGIYGMVAGYNNFTAFVPRTWHNIVASQADQMNIVKTEVKTEYVVDPAKAAEAVSAAAAEGAKQGADASIKANLGK